MSTFIEFFAVSKTDVYETTLPSFRCECSNRLSRVFQWLRGAFLCPRKPRRSCDAPVDPVGRKRRGQGIGTCVVQDLVDQSILKIHVCVLCRASDHVGSASRPGGKSGKIASGCNSTAMLMGVGHKSSPSVVRTSARAFVAAFHRRSTNPYDKLPQSA